MLLHAPQFANKSAYFGSGNMEDYDEKHGKGTDCRA